MTTSGLIERGRLRRIPKDLQLTHEYCFFLHDECAHLLTQYEAAEAHIVKFEFQNKKEAKAFKKLADAGVIEALREIGRTDEARKVALNHIKMAMVSDCLHHIYEALRCIEKRKYVVAFNLLRKPLMDSFVYLAWMLSNEEEFYQAFSSGDPSQLSNKRIGNIRRRIIDEAIKQTALSGLLDGTSIHDSLFSPSHPDGLYELFQHAVHLVTVERMEIRTSAENFNFIFKNPFDDDIVEFTYQKLPRILLLLAHVILELFDRMQPMDPGAKTAFKERAFFGLALVGSSDEVAAAQELLNGMFAESIKCTHCSAPFKATRLNSARAAMREQYRCNLCRRNNHLPMSYIF